jgi:hypothetical protein
MIVSFTSLLSGSSVYADPLHAFADGEYWHHDSGWVFPATIGKFERDGIPQDVAGSRDAVAYYSHTANGVRSTASVDVFSMDSVAANELEARDAGRLSSEGIIFVGKRRNLPGTRVIHALRDDGVSRITCVYLFASGEWRVRIRVAQAPAGILQLMDAFVIAQRWETIATPMNASW